jgi:predicted dehydrogenase
MDYDPANRLFDPAIGGGALLDVGIYPISLASMIFGMPETITSTATMSASGVDEQAVIALRYPGGELAALTCASRTGGHNEAIIAGTKGLLRIEPPWWQPKRFSVHIEGQDSQTYDYPFSANGYEYEAMEVMHCLRAGRAESRLVSHDETLANLRIMDTIRQQWGLVYPQER